MYIKVNKEDIYTFHNMNNFINNLNKNNYLKIIKIKNRYCQNNNILSSVGYRDILINVKIEYIIDNEDNFIFIKKDSCHDSNNYIICEIQLHSYFMYKYKILKGHLNYKKYRNLLSI